MTNESLATELIRIGTLLKLNVDYQIPPLAKAILEAALENVEEARENAARYQAAPHRSASAYSESHRIPHSKLIEAAWSESTERAYEKGSFWDPELELTIRFDARRLPFPIHHILPMRHRNSYNPSFKPWKNKFHI